MIHLGNCLDVMAALPTGSVQALITDPPYGTTNLAFDRQPIDWPAFWAEARRVCTREAVMLLFADGLFTVDLIQSNRAEYRYRLVWKKTRGTGFLDANRRPLRKHEDIVLFCRAPKSSTYNPQRQAAESYTASTFKDGELPDGSHWGNGKGRHAWVDDGTRHPGSV
ncbi:hypothetical protein, partial [Deinococcus kurensis]|uniref:hypothetical protein n=1 Tax=Deinococcus kurensis TaxID=2662757 RepID=UPI002368E470